ncbi:MAG TPA: DUF2784 domain-containing protein [Rhodocyclaceae bacterium]|nr:DUF2784 domain-containing protein [Rhodocyclaceae bacterium]
MPGYQLLADAVLVLHAAIVLFVVAGLPLILIGNRYGWSWVNAPWFRLTHVATIGIVVAEAWIGMVCPLTTLEMWLRVRAQTRAGPYYANGFIEHWLQALLFWNAPAWVFTGLYSIFGLAVLATWWRFPPRFGRGKPSSGRTR